MNETTATRLCGLASAVVCSILLSACSGAGVASVGSGTTPVAQQSSAADPTDPASGSPAPTTMPSEASTLPAGTYRTRITQDELLAASAPDLQYAGVWTLVVTPDATYQLQCKVLTNVAGDCGNAGVGGQVTVERGDLLGSGSTVWFHDTQNSFTYFATWNSDGDKLTFSDYGEPDRPGPWDVNNLTMKPWTKVSG